MKPAEITTLTWKNDHVLMIDQRKLPHQEIFVKCRDYNEVAESIQQMVIRGAPAIGVAAAMGVALGLQKATCTSELEFKRTFQKVYDTLYQSRPTAVNLKWALERMKGVFERSLLEDRQHLQENLETEAIKIYEEDIAINRAMANNGKKFIQDGDSVLTYCNTGTLATAGYGTALGVIRAAHEEGKNISVFVSETRPYLQGLRLTSWELYKLGIPQKVITDNMGATLMAQKRVKSIFVGADRVAANGDVANKIGTYMLGVLAKYHHIPLYVVAPTSTIDSRCPTGKDIPIEERASREIIAFGGKAVGLCDVPTYNPSFDVTPAELITAIITEKGIAEPASKVLKL